MIRTVNCIGFGQISAAGNNIEHFKEVLRSGQSQISQFDKVVTGNRKSLYCGAVANIPYEDKFMTMARTAMFEAIKSAELNLEDFRENDKAGLLFGTSLGNTALLERYYREQECESIITSYISSIGQQLREILRVKGASFTLSNTCCTGISVISAARQLIMDGTLDLCVVGCVDILGDLIISGMDNLNALSKKNILRPFEVNRDGIILGEGAAFLVLANEKYINRKASIEGCSIKNDAVHLTAPDRNSSGLIMAIQESLKMSGITEHEIDIIFCCGNGTVYNDAMQAKAINKIWGNQDKKYPVTSIKPLIGHTLSVSGIIETIAIIIMMEEEFVVSIGNPYEQSPEDDKIFLLHQMKNKNFKYAILLSSGFSGVQAAQVIRK
ncbi:beta-ketoacyl synthase N-terminal-like domain-containing protein [Anaerosporobacter sp.]